MRSWTGKVTISGAYTDSEKHRFNVEAPSKLRAELAVKAFYSNRKIGRFYSDDVPHITVKFDDHIDAMGDECV